MSMKPVNAVLDSCRRIVRRYMKHIASILNKLSGGRLRPSTVTALSLLAHVPIAYLIAVEQNYWASGLLIVFGLMDALDGELARLQGTASSGGMLLDATFDRLKEVLLYSGAAYAFVAMGQPYGSAWAVAACGASLCVSYVKAKGETAAKDGNLSANEVNRLFQDGLMRFEIRMFILIVGLLSNQLLPAVIFIALFSVFTVFERLIKISRKL